MGFENDVLVFLFYLVIYSLRNRSKLVFVQLFLCFCLLGRPLVTETLHALCSNTKIVKEAYSKGNIKKQLLKDHN